MRRRKKKKKKKTKKRTGREEEEVTHKVYRICITVKEREKCGCKKTYV